MAAATITGQMTGSVVLDATWSSTADRQRAADVAAVTSADLVELRCESDEATARERLATRDSISDALGAPGFELFRRLIEDFERENDVPMADIAAALALQTRNGEEFLMSEPPPEKRRERPDRPARADRPAPSRSTSR